MGSDSGIKSLLIDVLKEQEDSYSLEFKDLLSSLPKKKGLLEEDTYLYNGFWYAATALHGLIDFQNHFQPHDTDIHLITPPKSGTTWLKAIVYALVNRKIHHPRHPHHPLLKHNPHFLVPFFEVLKPSDYDNFFSPLSTRILSSHLPYQAMTKSVVASECKIVYLCRDIKDTFISLFHFVNKTNLRPHPLPLEEAFDLFCRGNNWSGPIWDHILGYWKESLERPDKVLFMRFEEMKKQPSVELRRLADFLGYQFSQEEEDSGMVDQILSLCSFDTLTKLDINKPGKSENFGLDNSVFFRNGQVGDWKNYLTVEMAAKLDQITREKFVNSGLQY